MATTTGANHGSNMFNSLSSKANNYATCEAELVIVNFVEVICACFNVLGKLFVLSSAKFVCGCRDAWLLFSSVAHR